MERNVVSDEASTSATASTLMKLQLVPDQIIDDDHNGVEENNPLKKVLNMLFS